MTVTSPAPMPHRPGPLIQVMEALPRGSGSSAVFRVTPGAATDLPTVAEALEQVARSVAAAVCSSRDVDRIVGCSLAAWRLPDTLAGGAVRLRALSAILAMIDADDDADAARRWFATAHTRLRGLTPRGLLIARQEALWILLAVLRREAHRR